MELGVTTVDAFVFSHHGVNKGKSSLFHSSSTSSLVFDIDIDHATQLSTGTFSFPPMVSVPCRSANTNTNNGDKDQQQPPPPPPPILKEIVKPPNVEALYEWYCDQKKTPHADPSWGVLWPTAVSLANHLLSKSNQNSCVVKNKTVVELGAGLGICGLVAAKLGASTVTLTDREPYALHCALATAACNGFSTSVVGGAILDWSDPVLRLPGSSDTNNDNSSSSSSSSSNSSSSSSRSFCDVVLASDVLYDGETIQAFANACERLIDPVRGGILLLSDPRDERFPTARATLRDALLSLAAKNHRTVNFEVMDLPLVRSPVEESSSSGDGDRDRENEATTIDGRDHEQRMSEPTVLIRCTLGPSVPTRE